MIECSIANAWELPLLFSLECQGGAMLDESEHGRLSLEPVKRERKRSNGRPKLKSAALEAKGSHPRSDASSNGNSLSKPELESLEKRLRKRSKEASASDNSDTRVAFTVDALNRNPRIFGTNNQDLTYSLLGQLCGILAITDGKHNLQTVKDALATINGIGPKDGLEGLLAVQMVGVHTLAVHCLMRASWQDQTPEARDANIHLATKLLRTFTAQMEALNRHRGEVGQQMVVGNVNVNEGGQAIVGAVRHGSRGKA